MVVPKALPVSLVVSAIPGTFASAHAFETEDGVEVTIAYSFAAITADGGKTIGPVSNIYPGSDFGGQVKVGADAILASTPPSLPR